MMRKGFDEKLLFKDVALIINDPKWLNMTKNDQK